MWQPWNDKESIYDHAVGHSATDVQCHKSNLEQSDIDLSAVAIKLLESLHSFAGSHEQFSGFEEAAQIFSITQSYQHDLSHIKKRKIFMFNVIIDRLMSCLSKRFDTYSDLNVMFGIFFEWNVMHKRYVIGQQPLSPVIQMTWMMNSYSYNILWPVMKGLTSQTLPSSYKSHWRMEYRPPFATFLLCCRLLFCFDHNGLWEIQGRVHSLVLINWTA